MIKNLANIGFISSIISCFNICHIIHTNPSYNVNTIPSIINELNITPVLKGRDFEIEIIVK
jgi:hypothetical protein